MALSFKVTPRMLKGYYAAKKEWISENDGYNVSKFGITKAQYGEIRGFELYKYGMFPNVMKVAEINR